MSNVPLLPCPFCGGRAQGASGSSSIWIRCVDCGASSDENRESEEATIAAWNRRAVVVPAITREALLQALGGDTPVNFEQFIDALAKFGVEVK
jgi:Lar family restriction alleviation protein